jgi:hypothetical protein
MAVAGTRSVCGAGRLWARRGWAQGDTGRLGAGRRTQGDTGRLGAGLN